MMVIDDDAIVEAQQEADGDAVDDLRRRESVDLMGEDVLEPCCSVGVFLIHDVGLIQPLDDLGDVQARLHV